MHQISVLEFDKKKFSVTKALEFAAVNKFDCGRLVETQTTIQLLQEDKVSGPSYEITLDDGVKGLVRKADQSPVTKIDVGEVHVDKPLGEEKMKVDPATADDAAPLEDDDKARLEQQAHGGYMNDVDAVRKIFSRMNGKKIVEKPAKLERCVEDVKGKVDSPWAVCTASVMKGGPGSGRHATTGHEQASQYKQTNGKSFNLDKVPSKAELKDMNRRDHAVAADSHEQASHDFAAQGNKEKAEFHDKMSQLHNAESGTKEADTTMGVRSLQGARDNRRERVKANRARANEIYSQLKSQSTKSAPKKSLAQRLIAHINKEWVTINGAHVDFDKGKGPGDKIKDESHGGGKPAHGGAHHSDSHAAHAGGHGGHGIHFDPYELAAETANKSASKIVKADAAKQIVYGIVLEPEFIDAQNEWMTADDIERTAHLYLQKSRVVGKNHMDLVKAVPVESYIAPCDFTLDGGQYGSQFVKKGSWVLAVKILDRAEWDKIVEGEYTGFSIGGFGLRI